MTDETAEQVLTRVLDVHRWKSMGVSSVACECGEVCYDGGRLTQFPADEAFRAHVAAELAAALREAGLLVEGETVTEWGVRCGVEEADDVTVSRQRTRYPDRVTDWQPIEGGGDDAA